MSAPSYTTTIDINQYTAVFLNAYEGPIDGLYWKDVARLVQTDSIVGQYPGLGAAVGMKPWTGARQGQKPLAFKLSVTSTPYEASVIYPRDNFNARNLGMFEDNVIDMAQKAQWHMNWLTADTLSAGTITESYDSKYDGATQVFYFSKSHPINFDNNGANPTGSQPNLMDSTNMASLNVVDPVNPTFYECSQILQSVASQFLSLKDIMGDPVNGNCRKITILCGTQQHYAAFAGAKTLQTVLVNSVAVSNPILGMQSKGFVFDVVYEPRLESPSDSEYTLNTNAFYALRTDGPIKPILIQESSGIFPEALGPTSEYAATNNNVFFGVKHTYNVAPLQYTGALKCTMS